MRERIKDVVKGNALFLFFVVSIICIVSSLLLYFKCRIELYQTISLLIFLYFTFKIMYYEMTGVLND